MIFTYHVDCKMDPDGLPFRPLVELSSFRSLVELHFDILDDLSEELKATDYVQFILINELSYELGLNIIRIVEYHHELFYFSRYFCFVNYVASEGDADALKWLHKNNKVDITLSTVVYAKGDAKKWLNTFYQFDDLCGTLYPASMIRNNVSHEKIQIDHYTKK